jgi:hypothetical protein
MKVQKIGEDRINELKAALIGLSEDDYYWEIMNFLYEKINLRQPLNSVQSQIVATEILDAEVNNGGFDQFYFNCQLEYIDDAIEGLTIFGGEAFVRLAQASKAIYLKDKESYAGRRNPAFDVLDDEYYTLPSYRDRKVTYIKDKFELIVKESK